MSNLNVTVQDRKSSNNKTNSVNIRKRNMTSWWVSSLSALFLPALFLIIINLIKSTTNTFTGIFEGGELILSSFILITTTVILNFSDDAMFQHHINSFYLLFFTAFFELVTYTTIKACVITNLSVLLIASLVSVIVAIIVAWQCEKYVRKEAL